MMAKDVLLQVYRFLHRTYIKFISFMLILYRTYVVKHDGVQRGLAGEIISRFENKGLKIVAMKLLDPTKSIVEQHYAEHRDKDYYDDLIKFSTSGPMIAMVWEGPNCIKLVRRLVGATSIFESEIGSIRGDYSLTRGRNLVHGSDSTEAAVREIGIWFKENEIMSYPKVIDTWLLDR